METLFKQSADVVMQYASQAYQTAGLSANQYMETVTSFSASLLQSLGGDTEKAAKVADMAIIDMADNANKMGTSMEAIQNAYQGFAKQNYTMLDNLKLGYGGTKSEMERLLADAEKISGIHYDISSYADMVEAIHVVQTELGITGTTALEASETIQGSVNAAKAAWANLVTGFADENADLGELIGNFADSVVTAADNIVPRFQQALVGIGAAITTIAPVIGDQIPALIGQIVPPLIAAGADLIMALLNGIINAAPSLVSAAADIINTLATGISENLPTLIPAAVEAILQIVDTLIDNVGELVDAALQIIIALADGLIAALPELLAQAPIIVAELVAAIITNAPKLIGAAAEIIANIVAGIGNKLGEVLEKGKEVVTNVLNGIKAKFSELFSAGKDTVEQVKSGITGKIGEFLDIGNQIVQGIKNGIANAWGALTSFVTEKFNGLVASAKSLLKIASPSKVFRDEVGQYISLGVAEGIEKTEDKAVKAAEDLAKNVFDKSKTWIERQTKYQGYSLKEQLELWKTAQSQFIKESKQYADAEEKIFDLRKKIQDEYYKKVEDITKDIEDLQDTYAKTLEDRTKEIFNSYGVFDQIQEREKVAGKDLMTNLKGQVNMMTLFYESLDQLAERGVGEGLVEEIRAMGPDAIDELAALLAMSDETLGEYADLYKQKQELANNQALKELEGLKEDTDKQIRENLDALEALYEENAPYVGKSFTDGLALGIKNGMSTVINAAVKVATEAVAAVKSTLGIHSPSTVFAGIGENMALGLGQGWEDEYANIKKTLTQGLDFGSSTADFGSSFMGVSSAGIVNGLSGAVANTNSIPPVINLVFPDGTKIATYMLPYLSDVAKANGTPILNPT